MYFLFDKLFVKLRWSPNLILYEKEPEDTKNTKLIGLNHTYKFIKIYHKNNYHHNKILISKCKILQYYYNMLLIEINKNDFIFLINKNVNHNETINIPNPFHIVLSISLDFYV